MSPSMNPVGSLGRHAAAGINECGIPVDESDLGERVECLQRRGKKMGPVPVVRVDAGDEVSARQPYPLVDRGDVSPVRRVRDHEHPRIRERRQHERCVVGGTIVDRNDLEVLFVLAVNAGETLGQVAAVVVARHDEADARGSTHTLTRCGLMIRAGAPTTVTSGGTSRMTTDPAPTVAPAPTETLSMIVAPAPI